MDYKETIETKIYSEPDEQHRIKEIGTRTVGEVFEELQDKLKNAGLMPDEYFLLSSYLNENNKMPDFIEAVCYPNFGGSEGIYFDVMLRCKNIAGQSNFMSFATGKTLGETTADYYKMSLISGECSMLLNGCGSRIENNVNSILILDEAETQEVNNALSLQKTFNEDMNRSNETANGIIDMLKTNNETVPETEDDNEMEE